MEKSVIYYREVLGFDVDLSNPFRAAVLSEGGAILGAIFS
jgi:hypothetical protein